MTRRPLIGISGSHNAQERQLFLRENYMQSVLDAGGIPVLLPQMADESVIPEILDQLDGLLLAGGGVDAAVLEYGGNDSDFAWGDVAASPFAVHRSRTGLVDFQQKLRTVVWQLQSKGIRVIMMSLPPLDAERYLDWISRGDEQRKDSIMSFLGDVSRIYRYQEIYSNAVTKIALENGCEFVDVRQEFLQSDSFRDLMCADGIHPNEKGQKVIIDAFLARYGDTALAKAN